MNSEFAQETGQCVPKKHFSAHCKTDQTKILYEALTEDYSVAKFEVSAAMKIIKNSVADTVERAKINGVYLRGRDLLFNLSLVSLSSLSGQQLSQLLFRVQIRIDNNRFVKR